MERDLSMRATLSALLAGIGLAIWLDRREARRTRKVVYQTQAQ